jgi:hypothetical protein
MKDPIRTSQASPRRMLLGEFIPSLVKALAAQRISPCILRNYEGFPDKNVGNDVDFMIHPSELPRAIRAVQSIRAIRIVGYIEQFHVAMLFLEGISPAPGLRAFQVDFIRSFTFKGMPYLTPETVLQSAVERRSGDLKFLVPSPVHEAIISLVTNLVVFGFVKEKYLPKVRETFRNHRSEVISALRPGFGLAVATHLVDSAIDDDRGKLLACVRPARIALSLRNLSRHPFHSLFAIVRHYSIVLGVRHSRRTLETCCILSPEEGVESATVEMLAPMLRYVAPELVIQEQISPTQTGYAISMAGILAWLLKEWQSQYTGRKNLTLRISTDSFQGLLANPRRYGYRGPLWFARLAGRLFPSPDLWILLDSAQGGAKPANGKTPAFSNLRALDVCRSFVKTRKVHAILNAGQSADRIAEGAYAAIIDTLARRANRKTKHLL